MCWLDHVPHVSSATSSRDAAVGDYAQHDIGDHLWVVSIQDSLDASAERTPDRLLSKRVREDGDQSV